MTMIKKYIVCVYDILKSISKIYLKVSQKLLP